MVEAIFFDPWIWILGGLLFVLVVFTVLAAVLTFTVDGVWGVGALFAGCSAFLLAGVYFGGILPPYDTSFYQVYRVTGEVSTLERAFSVDDGGTLSQSFVVGIDGVDLLIQSNDQRFRTVEFGDTVTLSCGKVFNYFQTPYYNCNFGG